MKQKPFYIIHRRVRASSIKDAIKREIKEGEVTDVYIYRKDEELISHPKKEVGFDV